MENDLLLNLNKLHTTPMGSERIRRNLRLDVTDTVQYCREIIEKKDAITERRGKNWYVSFENIIITVNASSYTIITARLADVKAKKQN